jgi:xanthomonalisin
MSENKYAGNPISKRFSLAVLPLAIAAAQLPLTAQAATTWAATHTSAFLLPSAPSSAAAQSELKSAEALTGYALNIHGAPALTNTAVTSLEVSQPLHITVVLKGRNDNALDKFLREQNQPGSANYQYYLTPAEFKARFAPTDAQVQAVVSHLRASGFRNITVSANNKLVSADGNANSVQSAFNASLKRFNYRGKPVYGNDTAAQVPSELGDTVDAVLGLQNAERPHRMIHRLLPATALIDPQSQATTMASAGQQVAHKPTDFAQIYGASSLPAATNTTVGIITWGDMTQTIADLKQFTQSAGLATVKTAVVPGGQGTLADDGDPSEWDLDSQDIIGVSGGVKQLIFYAAINGDSSDSGLTDASLTEAYNTATTDDVAKVINVSLGEDEASANSDGSLGAADAVFKQAAAQGQIFSVSSGDAGVYQWSTSPEGAPGFIGNYNSSGTKITTKITMSKYGVSSPASSPYVVAVGGTTLSTTGTTTWGGETVWNEGAAYADIGQDGYPADNSARIWATGGGISAYEAVPSWQTPVIGSSLKNRALPDVAFDAASSTGALIVIDGQAGQQVGGTSLASPIFVGGFARVESAHNNSIGLPTQKFYQTLPTNTSLVHDVTSGSNNGYSSYGYKPAVGWDYDTGFGSLQFSKLSATY